MRHTCNFNSGGTTVKWLSVPTCSCEDKKKAEEVKGASERISAVSEELIGCANRVAKEGDETNEQELEDLQDTLESTELLRRDWASQVCDVVRFIYSYLQQSPIS